MLNLKKMFSLLSALTLSSAAAFVDAACSSSISSLYDVAAAVECTTITLNGFTVPAGYGLSLNLLNGTTVTMNGDILFGNKSWSGPLFTVSGHSITFNGNGYKFDGGGPFYWDGQGLKNKIPKPEPMMKIKISGTFKNVKVVNSPARVYSVSNPAALLMTGLIIDDSQGDLPNYRSKGLPAGHNTDGFDVSSNDLTIQNSVIHNQVKDDCLAINKGTNIVFKGNSCTGGHGISIGSISSNVKVSGVLISGNNITSNQQGFRIKTDASATGSSVTNITYEQNTGIGLTKFGVLIDQSYPDTLGKPGKGVIISNVNIISPTSSLSVGGSAQQVAVNCGSGSCTGTWDWSGLQVSGGVTGPITGIYGILGLPTAYRA